MAQSFQSIYGRKPVAGQDFDPNNLSQDEFDYLTGRGKYAMPDDIAEVIEKVKREGQYSIDGKEEIEDWELGEYHFQSCIFIGDALYKNHERIWDNW